MEKFSYSLEKFWKAFLTLKNSIDKLYSEDLDEKYVEFVRDSVIQRFEYTIELFWKTLKNYLAEVHWFECYSPKSCLKLANSVWIIDNLDIFFEMIYVRNLSSHTYNQQQIEEIISEIDRFLPYLQSVYELLLKEGDRKD